jgi:hypothetical protein
MPYSRGLFKAVETLFQQAHDSAPCAHGEHNKHVLTRRLEYLTWNLSVHDSMVA